MTTIYTFKQFTNDLWRLELPIDGKDYLECVPLAEYEALNEKRLQLGRELSNKMETLEKVLDKGLQLKWILRRWADISPKLDDFDVVEGQSLELQRLIEDTKNV